MTKSLLRKRMASIQGFLQEAVTSAADRPGEPAVIPPALVEGLRNALEELRVAGEQLQRLDEELASARLAAKMQRQHWQGLLNFIPDGYLLTGLDGTIREANSAAATLFNLSHGQLLGRSLTAFVATEDRDEFRARLTRLSETAPADALEVHLQPRNGESFWAALTVAATRGTDGKPTGLQWSIRDLTEYKRAKEALHQSEERLNLLFQLNKDGIAVVGQAGRLLHVNQAACELLGHSQSELLQMSLDDFVTP